MFPTDAEAQIDSVVQNLMKLLIAAFVAKCGSGAKIMTQNVSPTEFDRESRWWVESIGDKKLYDQTDVDQYYSLTDIPPEKAMLSLTIEGNNISLCFMPKPRP